MSVKTRWIGVIIVLAAGCAALWMLRGNESGDTRSQTATDKVPMVAVRENAAEFRAFQAQEGTGPQLPRAVDLQTLRAKLPDNIYWQLDAPAVDPEVIRLRAEEKRSWDTLRGLVVSNTATDEQIDQYFDHQQKVSEDYLELSTLILEEYGDDLPESEAGAHELSVKMHSMKLQELPRKREEARIRKVEQDKKREAWRNQQDAGR